MRNYITLNGKNSNEINGLLIQELPPISKPQIRTEVEEIDGRDGDIVTKLGFAAYDKEFTVGLYKDFDINAIIAYFNSEGTVVFSNEPDKYYNYQIIDQIDFERLVRYRTATVRMHCQPFKYSNTEGARTLGNKGTASGEGSELVLENTAESPFNVFRHKGNATQKTYDGINICPNTEFNDLDGWTVPSTSYWSAGGNNALNINIPAGVNTFQKIYRQLTTIASHKYYICAEVSMPNGSSSAEVFLTNNTGSNYPTPSVFFPTAGFSNRKFSGILQPAADNAHIGFMVQAYNKTVAITAEIKNLFCVDLTAKYGAGNEPTIEICDTTLSYEPYVGGTASPNPDYPQDIHVVTGEQTIKITSKNLWDPDDLVKGYVNDNGTISTGGGLDKTTQFIPIIGGQSYTISSTYDGNTYHKIAQYDAKKNFIKIKKINSGASLSETTENNAAYIRASTYYGRETPPNVQLETGDQPTDYEPYKGQSYVIPFGDTYLAKVGDYADEPVKVGDTWYIRRAVGKVVLNGTPTDVVTYSNYGLKTNVYAIRALISNIVDGNTSLEAISDKYHVHGTGSWTDWYQTAPNITLGDMSKNSDGKGVLISAPHTENTQSLALAWLANNPATLYYQLATPTDEEITDQDLIDALETMYEQVHAYKGRTHVAAIAQSGNAPHIIEAEVQRSSDGNITNNGNIVSKPTLTIYGSGNIEVSLNGYQIFEITLGDEEYITIDTAAMEAYKDTIMKANMRRITSCFRNV